MIVKKERPIRGWWFPCLEYDPAKGKAFPLIRYKAKNKAVELAGTPVRAGQVHRLSNTAKPIRCCEYGLHASRTIFDALRYAIQYEFVCRVELWGEVNEGSNKLAARFRRIVRVYRIPKRAQEDVSNATFFSDMERIILREVRRQDRARKAKAATKAGVL